MATSFEFIVLANILLLLFSCNATYATIGINWGRRTPVKMVPSMVVDVLLQNNVKEAKIYTVDENTIMAFRGTDIGLTINAYSIDYVSTPERAKDWVQRNVVKYDNVNIKYVLVGSNAFATARSANRSFFDIVNAVRYVQEALDEVVDGRKTKAIIANSYSGVLKDVLDNTTAFKKPSETEFQDDVKEAMAAYLKFAAINDIPFVYEILPISFVHNFNIDYNFALFDNKSSHIIKDGNLVYRNLFEYQHDSFVWALKKVGAPDNLKIVVGQIGWPTDGFPGANYSTAERYYKGLLPLVTSNKGTPMRPGAPIDIYIHAIADEKLNPAQFSFTRHMGIYRSNGEPKYKIDLSGQGRDIFPVSAKGIALMPERWCVLDEKFSNWTKVSKVYNETCQKADCTSLLPGSSCSILTYHESVSYAFNSFFQVNFQAEDACDFDGLGKITVQNPSRNGCVFSVEVVRGNNQRNDGEPSIKFDGTRNFVILVLLTFLL